MTDRLADALAGIVGKANVLLDPELKAPYERDWTGRFPGRARCAVRPGTTAEVAAVLRACAVFWQSVKPLSGPESVSRRLCGKTAFGKGT